MNTSAQDIHICCQIAKTEDAGYEIAAKAVSSLDLLGVDRLHNFFRKEPVLLRAGNLRASLEWRSPKPMVPMSELLLRNLM